MIDNMDFKIIVRKPVVVKLSLSTPIETRCKCKHCGEGPAWYYYIREADNYQSPHDLLGVYEWIQNRTKRFCSDFYLFDDPSAFTNTQTFSFQHVSKGYSCRAHKNKSASSTNIVEFVVCDCGRTIWSIATASFMKSKPEIVNRKSSRTFPKKFSF